MLHVIGNVLQGLQRPQVKDHQLGAHRGVCEEQSRGEYHHADHAHHGRPGSPWKVRSLIQRLHFTPVHPLLFQIDFDSGKTRDPKTHSCNFSMSL